MSREAKLGDLIGHAKAASDLRSHPQKIRFTDSTHVNNGNYMRLGFPRKSNDAMLYCKNIKMRFNLNVESTDSDCILAACDARVIFNRMRVLSGSTVLFDLTEASQCFVLESIMECSNMDSVYERRLKGQQDSNERTEYTSGQEFIVDIAPNGTLLNSESLLPLSRMSDIFVEFWLERPERALYSPGEGAQSSFSISNIEILCNYMTSQSLSQYFNTHGVNFSVVDLNHRYNAILSQEYILRLSSSHGSLDGVTTVIREQQRVSDIAAKDKYEVFDSGMNRERYNILVNNSQWFEEDENSVQQSWQHLTDLYPTAKYATFFDDRYELDRNILCTNLMAAPPSFQDVLRSGVTTSNMNSDLCYRIRRRAPPETPLRSDSYLRSTAQVHLAQNGGDLKISF